MTFAEFSSYDTELRVRASPAESELAGLRVGRMVLNEHHKVDPSEVIEVIRESDYDVVVLRYPASFTRLAPHLQCSDLVSWQADTLMYFEAAPHRSLGCHSEVRLRRLDESEFDSATRTMEMIFQGYGNHYAGSPVFERIDTCAAYLDWTRREVARDSSAVLGLEVLDEAEAHWKMTGICVVDEGPRTYDEILLAGVHPSFRRKGLYSDALTLLKTRASEKRKERLLISTQATNIPALRAWGRSGFELVLVLNTLHVVRAGIFERLVGV